MTINRRKLKKYHTLKRLFFYVGLVPLFTSCVYYNTFYNAEKSFENATKLIEESPLLEEGEIPPQAKKLLDEAIVNSYVVLDKYPESKYVDDAYFIIANSHFIKGEFTLAEDYLIRLKNEFTESKFIGETRILLAYCHYKLDELDQLGNDIKEITETDLPSKYQFYLIYNLIAEMAIDMDSIPKAFNYYEKAITLTRSRSKKTSLYLKLVDISEKNDMFSSIITYLDKLSEIAPNQIKLDAKMDWIRYNRQLGYYNEIITEIDNLLGQSEYQSIHMKLKLEQAKVYLDQKDFETTKLLLSDFTSSYERKNESAEAFYHLGYIALMEDFDLILAKDYFDSAKKEKSNSKYGKKAKEMKVVIEDFTALQEEYEYKVNNPESDEEVVPDTTNVNIDEEMENTFSRSRDHMSMPMGRSKADATPDSLLFIIAEKLMFDFNKEDAALEKFNELVSQFPDSKFRSQSLFVLSHFFPEENWESLLANEYPESSYLDMISADSDTSNTLISKRDKTWDLISVSIDSTAHSFYKLYESEFDTTSLYYYAFMLDHYLNDLEGAINNYQEYVSFKNDDEFTAIAKNRIIEIEESITIEEELIQQKLIYANAINAYFEGEALDSVVSLFDLVLESRNSIYKTSAQRLKASVNKMISIYGFLEPNTDGLLDSITVSKLDSIYYNLGDIFDYELGLKDSAQFYYKKVLNDFEHSTFRHNTLLALNELDSNGVWSTLISVEFPESIKVVDSTRSNNRIITDSLNETFVKDQNDLLNLLAVASENFIKPEIDTLLADDNLDSAVVEIELPEFSLPEFPLIEEMIPEIFEPKEIDEDVIIQNVEEDSINQILTDTLYTELINIDSNVVVQEISEFQIDSTWTEHVVYYGESLSSISQKELGSEKYWNSIYKWNKEVLGENPALIFPYQILKIRKPASYEIEIVFDDLYIVSTGETLWSIAKIIYKDEYAWSLLLHDNKETLENPDIIYPGYPLVIRAQFVELRNDN